MNEIYDIAVIGGGPGGISAVVEAKILGLEKILMIEKGDNHSQTIRKFYKNNKRVDKDYKGQIVELKGNVEFSDGTKESTIDYFDELLEKGEFDFVSRSEVEKIEKEDDIFMVSTASKVFKAKNVVVAIGKMGKPNKPDYSIPSSIKQLVNFNLDKCSKDENILIVGGGNSAAEYAIDLCKSNKVTLNYRKESFTRLNDTNEDLLNENHKKGDLDLKLGCDIVSLEDALNAVKVCFDNGEEMVYDRVIYAIGGTTPVDFLRKCGIGVDEKSVPIFDENLQTEVSGLFVAGDIAARRGGSIALALNHSYKIIEHILQNR